MTSDLVKILLAIEEDAEVYATPAFAEWARYSHPLTERSQGGLWLLDSADRSTSDGFLRRIAATDDTPSFDAALLLLRGSLRARSFLRRLRRALRRRRVVRRRSAASFATIRPNGGLASSVVRLGYSEPNGLPRDFFPESAGAREGVALVITRTPLCETDIWSALKAGGQSNDLHVSRIQLRERGAAVVTMETGDQAWIARIVAGARATAVVARNSEALGRLRQALPVGSPTLQVLPRPVVETRVREATILIETCLPGVLAWTLAKGPMEARIHDAALGFLERLRVGTETTVELGREYLADVVQLEDWSSGRSDFVSAKLRDAVREELRCNLDTLEGASVKMHPSHGDFGYGNILVEPSSGEISGVIDWDTARADDLPGMDIVNMAIQRRHILYRESLREAATGVWNEASWSSTLAQTAPSVSKRAIFSLALIKYVTRALSYPNLFTKSEARFADAIDWIGWLRTQNTEDGDDAP